MYLTRFLSVLLLSALSLPGCDDGKGGGSDSGGSLDKDGDGYEEGEDCDDTNPLVNPGQTEQCDGVDNNCDDLTDDETSTDAAAWYPDADADGYGGDDGMTMACEAPEGNIAIGGDCDDSIAEVNPDATEICDGQDNNCDGATDDDTAIDALSWYPDTDGDHHGTAGGSLTACEAPEGYAALNDDCDDNNPLVYPGSDEWCDHFDNDCDTEVDENAVDANTWYPDGDEDGFADEAAGGAIIQCDQPEGAYVTFVGDCNDGEAAINPNADEVCDGLDNDCDTATSEAGTATWTDTAGTTTDLTADLSGTIDAPATYTLSTDGTLRICDGTWYTKLIAEADVSILGLGADPSLVILDGGGVSNLLSILTAGTDVSVSNLTMQNGAGELYSDGFTTLGGAVACTVEEPATLPALDLSEVVLADNTASYGGAMYSLSCDLSLDDVEITGNVAESGGAIYSNFGAFSLSNSSVMLNQAMFSMAGLFLANGTVPATISDSLISTNAASNSVGGLYLNATDLSCTSSAGIAAGFTSNSAGTGDAGAVYLTNGATFTSSGCDFGTAAAGDDNGLYDIETGASLFNYFYGDDQTFSCTDSLCGTESTYTIGTDDVSFASGTIGRGNIYLADQDGTIDSFATSLKSSAATGCMAYFYVLSAATTGDATWDVEWTDTVNVTSTTTTFVSSGDIGLPVEVGRYYGLVTGWDCDSTTKLTYAYESTTAVGGITGIGSVVGRWVDTTFDSTDYTSSVATGYDAGVYNFYSTVDVSH